MEISPDIFDGLSEPALEQILHDCLFAKRLQNALQPASTNKPSDETEKDDED